MAAYTLFSQAATGSSLALDNAAYTMGVQFSVSQAATLTAVWFYSAASAGGLPGTIALYAVSGTSLVHSESASWSGAAGSGWVRAAFSSPPLLTVSAAYKAVVLQTPAVDWYSATAHYWDSGAGSGGVTNGPLTAPNNAGAGGGQDSFNAGSSLTYPATSFNAANYWVDPEITQLLPATAVPGCLAATGALLRRGSSRARGRWRGMAAQVTSGPLPFTIGLLTAYDAPGAAVLGLLDEAGSPVLDEAAAFILTEDGS